MFERPHSIADELAWLDSEGPTSPALVDYLAQRAVFDYVILFSYRYYHAWHGARRVPAKAILVPTAERDPAVGARHLRSDVPRRARHHVQLARRARDDPRGDRQPGRAGRGGRRRLGGAGAHRAGALPAAGSTSAGPFAIYVGRIDENKGCDELFQFFQRYAATFPRGLDLVLVGSAVMPIPSHPRIHHLGFLSDEDKFDALAAADLLIMPSYFESLSMVALEAWALGRPVLANGRCDVLKGQCLRSNAGLFYESYEEFAETLYGLESNGPLHARLGPERPRVLPTPLFVAGDRAEVPRHVQAARGRRLAPAGDAGPSWLVGQATR